MPELPEVEITARRLSEAVRGATIDLKKGGIAGIRMDSGRRGELVALLRPRELDRIAAGES